MAFSLDLQWSPLIFVQTCHRVTKDMRTDASVRLTPSVSLENDGYPVNLFACSCLVGKQSKKKMVQGYPLGR